MQGLLKRLARVVKRVSTVLALPILVLLITILLINPSQLLEFTTNIAEISSIFRILMLIVFYGFVGSVLYFTGHLPIVDRLLRNRIQRTKQDQSSQQTVTTEKPKNEDEKSKGSGILGRTLKAGVKELTNRAISNDDKPKTVDVTHDNQVQTTSEGNMDEDDFYSFLGSIQVSESEDNESSTTN